MYGNYNSRLHMNTNKSGSAICGKYRTIRSTHVTTVTTINKH